MKYKSQKMNIHSIHNQTYVTTYNDLENEPWPDQFDKTIKYDKNVIFL